MQITPSQGCCALYEIHHLNMEGSPSTLREFVSVYDNSYASRGVLTFAYFTDNVGSGLGRRLAKYITDKGLGIITKTPQLTNPKTRRDVECWFWAIDWEALRAWNSNR